MERAIIFRGFCNLESKSVFGIIDPCSKRSSILAHWFIISGWTSILDILPTRSSLPNS